MFSLAFVDNMEIIKQERKQEMKEVPVWNTKRITERKMDSRKQEPTLISEVEGAALQRDMSGFCMCVLYLQGPSETQQCQ